MQRFYIIIVVCFMLIPSLSRAQGIHIPASFSNRLQEAAPGTKNYDLRKAGALTIQENKSKEKYPFLPSITTLHPAFYNQQLGIICRKEWQLEKVTRVPFRFRLGSVDYTDRLEGKAKTRIAEN